MIFAMLKSIMQPQNPNPYDFITNPNQPAPQSKLGGSLKSRIILVVVGVIVLMILAMVISNLMSSADRKALANLKTVAAEQIEIIRVSELGVNDAIGSQAIGYAITVNMVVKTSQKEFDERLSAHKVKLTQLEKTSKLDKKTEELLASAASNNRYDEQLTEILDDLLQKHQKTLKAAYESSKSAETKAVLSEVYNNAESLANAKSPDAVGQ